MSNILQLNSVNPYAFLFVTRRPVRRVLFNRQVAKVTTGTEEDQLWR